MGMNDLFGGGAKKSTRTLLTTGTGTFVPSADGAVCRVRIQAGGGGGYTSAVAGGGGAMVEVWLRVPIAGLPYVVGAGGAVATDGSKSTFGQFTANPGQAGKTGSIPGWGGILGMLLGSVNATAATIAQASTLDGVSGGAGGYSTEGCQVGFPYVNDGSNTYGVSPMRNQTPGNGQGTNSGGDSFYGKGGTTGNSPAATAYGAGGGMNAAGRGGCIDIEDFGA